MKMWIIAYKEICSKYRVKNRSFNQHGLPLTNFGIHFGHFNTQNCLKTFQDITDSHWALEYIKNVFHIFQNSNCLP